MLSTSGEPFVFVLSRAVVPYLFEVWIKVTFVLVVAVVAAVCLRRSPANLRRRLWLSSVISILVAPALVLLAPSWIDPLVDPPSHQSGTESGAVREVRRPAGSGDRLETEADTAASPPTVTLRSPRPIGVEETEPNRSLPLRRHWREILASLWLAGVVLNGARLGLRHTGMLLTVRRARIEARWDRRSWAEWEESLSRASEGGSAAAGVSLLASERTDVPLAWRRAIVLPPCAREWPALRRELVLRHELAHIARRDHLAILLSDVAGSIYWVHPLVWLASAKLRTEQERAADDAVLSRGARPSEYARELLAVAAGLGRPSKDGFQPAAARSRNFEARIRSILDPSLNRDPDSPSMRRATSGALAAATVFAAAIPLWPGAHPRQPDRDGALIGIVQDREGRPIEGARVLLGPTKAPPAPRLRPVVTDDRGRFRAAIERSEGYSVYVEASGFAPSLVERRAPGETLVVVLDRGVGLEGLVRDARTREPIERARVTTQALAAAIGPVWVEPGPGVVDTTTDGRGRFRFTDLARGPRSLWATASGYGRAEVRVSEGEAPVEVFLFPGSGISGRVRGPRGEPVAKAMVRAFVTGNARPWDALRSTTETDAEGRFELLGLEPGRYRVLVHHPDLAAAVLPEIDLEERETPQVAVGLSAGAMVSGRLVDQRGNPLAGEARFERLNGEILPWTRVDEAPSAEASGDGRFQMARLPRGRVELAIEPEGFAGRRIEVEVQDAAGRLDLGEIRFADGLTITGFVIDEKGVPLAEATVSAYRGAGGFPDFFERRELPAKATASADGSFALRGLEPGGYRVGAFLKGYSEVGETTVDLGARDGYLVLRMNRGAAVSGRVVDVDGLPIETFSVVLSHRAGETETRWNRPISSAEDGRFFFDTLSPGDYVVAVTANELKPTSSKNIELVAGTTKELGEIVLRPGAILRGRVRGAGGVPVPGTTIRTHPEAPGGTVVTDREGAFEFRGFEDGVVDLRASHPDYAAATVTDVEVYASAPPASVEIQLGAGGRVEGRVVDRDGSGISGRSIEVRPRGDPRATPARETTGPDGRFAVDRLPPGLHRIVLQSSGNLVVPLQQEEVEIREGETTYVELRSRRVGIHGQATKGGAPLSGAYVRFRPPSLGGGGASRGIDASRGPHPLHARARADGSYELWVDEPGEYLVEATLADGVTSLPMKEVVVPDSETHRLDLSFETTSVAGRVVSRPGGEPLPRARIAVYEAGAGGRFMMSTGSNGAGEFRLELEPGEYRAHAEAAGFGSEEKGFVLGEGETGKLTIPLSKGFRIRGRVVDAQGGLPGRFYVHVVEEGLPTREPPRCSQWGDVYPDGTFELNDLRSGRHNVLAGSDVLGFAFAPGVPGGDEILLTLRPAGWVDVLVLEPNGAPAGGVRVAVTGIDGRKARGVFGRTDEEGRSELYAPAGELEIKAVNGEGLEGTTHVAVSENARTAATIDLRSRANE